MIKSALSRPAFVPCVGEGRWLSRTEAKQCEHAQGAGKGSVGTITTMIVPRKEVLVGCNTERVNREARGSQHRLQITGLVGQNECLV